MHRLALDISIGIGIGVLVTLTLLTVGCAQDPDQEPFFSESISGEGVGDGVAGDLVRIGGDRDYPPFEFEDDLGRPQGFNIEIVRRIAEIMDLDIAIELTEWSEARRRLEQGEVDMLAGMYRTAERERLHDFAVPHFVAAYGMFVRSDSHIRGAADLEDASIVVHEGDLGHDYVREEGLGSKVVTVSDWPEVLTTLSEGTGDVAIFGMGQGMREIKRGDYQDIRMVETPLFHRPYAMAVQEGDAELLALLNEGLSVLKANGEFDRIYEDWFGVLEQPPWWQTRAARVVLWTVVAALLIAAAAGAWVVSLRRQVAQRTAELQVALQESFTAQRELEQANEAKSRFLANVTHELRTPINGVVGMATLLDRTELGDDQRSLVGMIRDASTHLARLIGDLLDASRIAAGRLVLSPSPFRLQQLARWLETTLGAEAGQKGLAFDLSFDGPAATVHGDHGRIAQIVTNLATNAIRYTERGEVTVALRHDGRRLEITVTDTGPGIPAEDRNRMFEPFVQVHRTTTSPDDGGLGLGLSIVRSLVDLLNGTIAVRSTPRQGSRFDVTLPLPTVEEESSAAVACAVVAPTARLRGKRVLIAEDEAINRMYLKGLLVGAENTVVEASDGREAVEAARGRDLDLILMDVSMPTLDGRQAAREIRSRERSRGEARRPIIALTAHAYGEEIRRCFEAGMDGYVAKPYTEAALFAEIARVLAAERNRSEKGPDEDGPKAAGPADTTET
ncbi:MAG: transporter substrate-binding domain-containing protein [Spirochaetaceae bacterium]